MSGVVSLVGAGPGDAELLTLRAVQRLGAADVVFFDALVSPDVLELAPDAQHIPVGKRAGGEATPQRVIEGLMVRAAQRGQRVVRLKCGDPFVLGRGGEEAIALSAAGVPFEVVPGISAAIGAPAAAHIPVTHRGVASGFLVVSGHAPAAFTPILEGLAPNSATVVVLMGLRTCGAVAATLLGRGWRAETPVAIVLSASTPDETVHTTQLEALATGSIDVNAGTVKGPGLLVIGDVVDVAAASPSPQPAAPLVDDVTLRRVALGG